MQAAPAAPSAPAMVAVIRPVRLKSDSAPCALEAGHRDEHADQEVGDADAEQRLERIAELGLTLMEQRAVRAPRQHGAGDEQHPFHGVASRCMAVERCQAYRGSDMVETGRAKMTDVARIPADDDTGVGSYFVANYPPFSVWTADAVVAATRCRRSHAPPAPRRAARAVPAHSVLPEALSLLLLPRLHGQERPAGEPSTSTRWRASGSWSAPSAGDRRPADRLRVLRRRHAVVSFDAAARGPGRAG